MSLIREFKEFAMKGNVVDMAVGIIIGAAFGKIVTSLVGDVIMPVVGLVAGKVDFKELAFQVGDAKIMYGNFIQTVVDFLIVAVAIFAVIRAMNTLRERVEGQPEEAAPVEPPEDVKLLREIRDSLQSR